jgi:hypothetical protein
MMASVESKNSEVYKTEVIKEVNKRITKTSSKNIYKEKLESLKEMTEVYTSKLQFCLSFLSYLSFESKYGTTTNASGIYGSFLRKIFEFPYALLEYINSDDKEWKSGYGNFSTGDIDIFILKELQSNMSNMYLYNKFTAKTVTKEVSEDYNGIRFGYRNQIKYYIGVS